MTELKTLKDFIKECERRDMFISEIILEHLKAEAIKWVKDAKENRDYNGELWTDGKIFGFKHFFNLTEEDLKEEFGENKK